MFADGSWLPSEYVVGVFHDKIALLVYVVLASSPHPAKIVSRIKNESIMDTLVGNIWFSQFRYLYHIPPGMNRKIFLVALKNKKNLVLSKLNTDWDFALISILELEKT